MSFAEKTILWIYGFLVFVWVIRHIALSWIKQSLHKLTRSSPRRDRQNLPRVTAIIPAKDEEDTLSGCLESICAQTYAALEILVVNDRSTDSTAQIAEHWQSRDDRVRLIPIHDLPKGWTGKTHALHVATREASGDWLWFVDSDTRHHADALAIMMEYGRSQQASLVSLMPELRCETFWEKVLQPLEGIVLMRSFSPLAVNNDASKVGFANGQCLLVEAKAYHEVGGHDAVRGRFVEDIYLAQNLKSSGHRIRLALGTDISSTRMYTSLDQIVRGWSRILYDALGRRPGPLLGKIIEPLIFGQSGEFALAASVVALCVGATSPFWWTLFGLSLLHQVLKSSMLFRLFHLNAPRTAWHALWYPLAGIVSAWISFDAIRSCLTGRVTWRGTHYQPAIDTTRAPLDTAQARGKPIAITHETT
jgi:glycosyltransferase involved in cell wall biosynthesis